ncbi:MAG TPA: hypothetical protein PLS49_07125, partial [Candidatus Woesebacteria bacterium]|nr:hypothetical protein [Candidatus Woesebacteria bacterium]
MSIDSGETPLQQPGNELTSGESPLTPAGQQVDSPVQNNDVNEANKSVTETVPNSVETSNDQETKEKKAAIKKQEAATITHAVLSRLSNEIPTNGTMTDAQKSIRSFTQLSEHARNPQLEFNTPWPTTDGKPLKFTFTGTDKYEASEKGNLRLLSINTKQVDTNGIAVFMCRLEGLSKDVPI